jgi:hypothetical protein
MIDMAPAPRVRSNSQGPNRRGSTAAVNSAPTTENDARVRVMLICVDFAGQASFDGKQPQAGADLG